MSIGNCSHIVVCGCSQIEIHHLHSQENIVADALSRPEPNTVQQHPPTTTATTLVSTLHAPPPPAVPGVSFSEMSLLQQSYAKVEFLYLLSSLSVVSVPFSRSNLLYDMSTGILLPLVSEKMRRSVFMEAIHNISHPGKHASRRLQVSRSFAWELFFPWLLRFQ